MLPFVVIWLVCGVIAAKIGSTKGESTGGFIAGFFLGPLGIILALVSKGNRKPCPFCRESVNPEASVCPHCQKEISTPMAIVCPSCGQRGQVSPLMRDDEVECPGCKKVFQAKNAMITS